VWRAGTTGDGANMNGEKTNLASRALCILLVIIGAMVFFR
jgi:hypothetical protein